MSSLSASLRRTRIWMTAARLPFLTATFVPIVLGTAIAWYQRGSFNFLYFVVTVASVSLAHIGTNLTNDYYDHLSGNDEANPNFSPFSGGSRVIQDGRIAAKHVLYAALLSFAVATALGIWLVLMTQKVGVLALGFLGLLCGFFYTASPMRIGYHSLGELAVGFGFGPLTLLGAYWIQTFSVDLVPAAASLPIGILITLVLLINEFPDYDADKAVGKRTLVVSLGKERAVWLYSSLLILTYAFIVVMVVLGVFPTLCLAALLTLPIAHKAMVTLRRFYNSPTELLPANAATIALHFLLGMLLSIAFALSPVVGDFI